MSVKPLFSVSNVGPGLDELRKALRAITVGNACVAAGVVGKGAAAVRGEEGGEPLTNVKLALIHEFGAPAKGIPARPFILASFAKNRERYRAMLTVAVRRGIIAGVARGFEGAQEYLRLLELIGAQMAADMKAYVTQGPTIPPPNAPATLARKLERGKAELARRQRKALKRGDDPRQVKVAEPRTLVDTGRMVNSITWELRGVGKDPT